MQKHPICYFFVNGHVTKAKVEVQAVEVGVAKLAKLVFSLPGITSRTPKVMDAQKERTRRNKERNAFLDKFG